MTTVDERMRILDAMSQEEIAALMDQASRVKDASIELARQDFNEFAERVMKDETTGDPILQAWMHEDWSRKREQFDKALFISAVGLGKSKQFSVAYPVWLLGRKPRLRIAIVSKNSKIAKQLTNECAKLIEESADVREVFPNLKPGDIWNEGERVIERPPGVRDPSIKPIGVNTDITGMRFDVVILDDVLDLENSRIQSRRDAVETWINSVLFSRLEPDRAGRENTKVFFVGNAWNKDDVYERFGKRKGWALFRYPVVANKALLKQCPHVGRTKAEGGLGIKLGDTVWPQRYTQKYLDDLKASELPAEWNRARMCVADDDSDARFRPEWVQKCLDKGYKHELMVSYDIREFLRWDWEDIDHELELHTDDDWDAYTAYTNDDSDFWVVTGVDLSTGEGEDLTCLTTIAVSKENYRRFLLNVESGKWTLPEIEDMVKKTYARYGGMFMVESVGMQKVVRQALNFSTSIPIFQYNTSWTKADPRKGIEQIAREMRDGKWVFPARPVEGSQCIGQNEEIEELCAEFIAYNPHPSSHTGDRAMSCWFAQILAVRLELRHEREREDREAYEQYEERTGGGVEQKTAS